MKFVDRQQAGHQLAVRLSANQDQAQDTRATVLALPRGGVPVGAQIAQHLHLPLTVVMVRKIGAPDNPEYGLGALTETGVLFLDQQRMKEHGFSRADLSGVIQQEQLELERRRRQYRPQPLPDLSRRRVIVVDDGIATGATLKAALKLLGTKHQPQKIVVAAPVCAADTAQGLATMVDELVCLHQAQHLSAISQFYEHFNPVSDQEVKRLLTQTADSSNKVD